MSAENEQQQEIDHILQQGNMEEILESLCNHDDVSMRIKIVETLSRLLDCQGNVEQSTFSPLQDVFRENNGISIALSLLEETPMTTTIQKALISSQSSSPVIRLRRALVILLRITARKPQNKVTFGELDDGMGIHSLVFLLQDKDPIIRMECIGLLINLILNNERNAQFIIEQTDCISLLLHFPWMTNDIQSFQSDTMLRVRHMHCLFMLGIKSCDVFFCVPDSLLLEMNVNVTEEKELHGCKLLVQLIQLNPVMPDISERLLSLLVYICNETTKATRALLVQYLIDEDEGIDILSYLNTTYLESVDSANQHNKIKHTSNTTDESENITPPAIVSTTLHCLRLCFALVSPKDYNGNFASNKKHLKNVLESISNSNIISQMISVFLIYSSQFKHLLIGSEMNEQGQVNVNRLQSLSCLMEYLIYTPFLLCLLLQTSTANGYKNICEDISQSSDELIAMLFSILDTILQHHQQQVCDPSRVATLKAYILDLLVQLFKMEVPVKVVEESDGIRIIVQIAFPLQESSSTRLIDIEESNELQCRCYALQILTQFATSNEGKDLQVAIGTEETLQRLLESMVDIDTISEDYKTTLNGEDGSTIHYAIGLALDLLKSVIGCNKKVEAAEEKKEKLCGSHHLLVQEIFVKINGFRFSIPLFEAKLPPVRAKAIAILEEFVSPLSSEDSCLVIEAPISLSTSPTIKAINESGILSKLLLYAQSFDIMDKELRASYKSSFTMLSKLMKADSSGETKDFCVKEGFLTYLLDFLLKQFAKDEEQREENEEEEEAKVAAMNEEEFEDYSNDIESKEELVGIIYKTLYTLVLHHEESMTIIMREYSHLISTLIHKLNDLCSYSSQYGKATSLLGILYSLVISSHSKEVFDMMMSITVQIPKKKDVSSTASNSSNNANTTTTNTTSTSTIKVAMIVKILSNCLNYCGYGPMSYRQVVLSLLKSFLMRLEENNNDEFMTILTSHPVEISIQTKLLDICERLEKQSQPANKDNNRSNSTTNASLTKLTTTTVQPIASETYSLAKGLHEWIAQRKKLIELSALRNNNKTITGKDELAWNSILMLSCCLSRSHISATLRMMIIDYKSFNDVNIKKAVKIWCSKLPRDRLLPTFVRRYGRISDWDTSAVTDMSELFKGQRSFNTNINKWDVRNVITIERMFDQAESFDQPLNVWKVHNVKTMERMFQGATRFNQPLNDWNISSVHSMKGMFAHASSFDKPLNQWNVWNVEDMSEMFLDASQFNQSLNSWTVDNVQMMSRMFCGAKAFNQSLSCWNVEKVVNMENTIKEMFDQATSFKFLNEIEKNWSQYKK